MASRVCVCVPTRRPVECMTGVLVCACTLKSQVCMCSAVQCSEGTAVGHRTTHREMTTAAGPLVAHLWYGRETLTLAVWQLLRSSWESAVLHVRVSSQVECPGHHHHRPLTVPETKASHLVFP